MEQANHTCSGLSGMCRLGRIIFVVRFHQHLRTIVVTSGRAVDTHSDRIAAAPHLGWVLVVFQALLDRRLPTKCLRGSRPRRTSPPRPKMLPRPIARAEGTQNMHSEGLFGETSTLDAFAD